MSETRIPTPTPTPFPAKAKKKEKEKEKPREAKPPTRPKPDRVRGHLPKDGVLGIAMVGHAFMGRAHANAFRQVGHFFELPLRLARRVVVGRQIESAEAARDKLGFDEAAVDLDQVLARDDVHIVDVATPNDSHHAITMRALAAGKHVLCEKPLALSLAQAKEMAAVAKRAKVRAGLWHNYRRAPAVSLAQRMIARGDIGQVRQVRAVYLQDWLASKDALASWRTQRRVAGSGAHGDLNAHLIDLVHFLTGLRFNEVCALEQTFTKVRPTMAGKRSTVDVDDAFAFLARLDKGVIGTFEATRVAPGHKNMNRVEVCGSEGSIEWNLERMNELRYFTFADGADTQGFRTIMCMDSAHPYAGSWWPDGHIIGYEHTFVHHVADFVQALASGAPFAPDFDDGVRVQAVLEAALESVRTRSWQAVQA